jgi:Fur family ferric uptake transcriptional regulator
MPRRTRQRDAIEAVFRDAARPLGPAEVLALARVRVPSMNLATVYRALKRLIGERRVRPVDLPGEPARYERADLDHHHHFRCDDCRRVYDVPGCPGVPGSLLPRGFRLRAHEVVLFGRCARCGPARARRRPARRRRP